MKIALYIEDGLEQIVLTPESETEKSILGKLHDGSRSLKIHRGSFYACRGGWVRHKTETSYDRLTGQVMNRTDDESSIIVLQQVEILEAAGDGLENGGEP